MDIGFIIWIVLSGGTILVGIFFLPKLFRKYKDTADYVDRQGSKEHGWGNGEREYDMRLVRDQGSIVGLVAIIWFVILILGFLLL